MNCIIHELHLHHPIFQKSNCGGRARMAQNKKLEPPLHPLDTNMSSYAHTKSPSQELAKLKQ